MIGMRFKAFQGKFFDPKKVTDPADRAKRKVLSRFGSFVRQTAKSSIRKRKKVSSPGKPPTNRTGRLKKFIFFGYNPGTESVVVGPAKLNQISFTLDGAPVGGLSTEVLEYGGEFVIWEVFKFGRWQRIDLRSKRGATGFQRRKRKIRIEARPFMQPAKDKELPQLEDMWKNSIK